MTSPHDRSRAAAVVAAEIRHLEQQLAHLERGELDPELFKKIRLQYGIYSMRGASTAYMVRVRVPLGRITAAQLETLADVCDQFTPARRCHVTTRQAVQLYGVERSQVVAFLRQLAAAGLTTREASGNVVRNIACCPWAGVAPDEPFDVTPYALAVSDYLLRNPLTQLLPRKIKIAFEGCPVDHARVMIHDIGVVAMLRDGEPGFRIYAGGGLGPVPRAGQLLESWTAAELLLPTIDAILRVFERSGERRSRARARLKFLVEQLGWEVFRQRVLEERRLVWATQSGEALQELPLCTETPPAFDKTAPTAWPDADQWDRWTTTNVSPQRQPESASVVARVLLGDLTVEQLRGLARVARRCAGSVRLMNTQNVLLRHVRRSMVPAVYDGLRPLGLAGAGAGRLADITRCPGADSCLSAIARPRGLAEALEARCRNGLARWADTPLSIKISGCPNACGQHHIADIGCFGVALRAGDRYVPCYQLLVGGGVDAGRLRFGRPVARVPSRRVPEAVERLVQLFAAQQRPQETFAAFVDRTGMDDLQQALADLADVTQVAQTPELCVDLGSTEPFKPEAGKGECAA